MKVNIADIIIDPQVQLKARRLDNDTVSAYVEALSNGAEFPPVVVFQNGAGAWLGDGFHRVSAYRFLGLTEIDAEIRHGTKDDAMIFAATSNATHGKPMSRAEKQEAGERLIKMTEWSDREIARQLAVAQPTIGRWRGKLTESDTNVSQENLDNSTPDIPGLIDLICGDFDHVADTLEAESIDVIITDPPYSMDAVPLYGVLAKHAARLLKPGGSLLAMAGQSYLPAVYDQMRPHLAYNWTVAYLTLGGQSSQLWQRKVNTFWKPVVWYVKSNYSGPWVGDVAKSDNNDKRYHEWGQSESGMADLVERFSKQGDLILDPFCGAGTTGVVALALNRRFIGIDIDPQAIETTRTRIYGDIGRK